MADLEGFRGYLNEQQKKYSTSKVLLDCLKRIDKLFPKWEAPGIRQKLSSLLQDHKATYVNNLIVSLRVYGHYLHDEVLENLEFFREQEPIKGTLSDEEIERFLALPAPKVKHTSKYGVVTERPVDPDGYARWTLFYSLMAFTGARPGEIAHLTVDTVDFGRSLLLFTDTKINIPRNVPIPPNLIKELKTYISTLDGKYLFPSRRGGTEKGVVVDNVDWHYNFHSRLKRMGLKRIGISPYSLRHSFITRLLEEDVALFKVMKVAGHHDSRTTQHYTHLTEKDMQYAVRKHPLVRKSQDPKEILAAIHEVLHAFNLVSDQRFIVTLNQSSDSLRFEAQVVNPC